MNSKNWLLANDIELPTAQCMPTPLPITLISFNATKRNKSVILNWEIASQVNNKGFLLQHSIDGNNWNDISFIYAGEKLKYEYLHETPINGINFYRFIQEDWDGTIIYSPIRSVQFDDSNEISVYPNPTNSNVNISGLKGDTKIEIVDVLGHSLYTKFTDQNQFKIDISNYNEGIYILLISNNAKKCNNFLIYRKLLHFYLYLNLHYKYVYVYFNDINSYMKYYFTLLLVIITNSIFAQTPFTIKFDLIAGNNILTISPNEDYDFRLYESNHITLLDSRINQNGDIYFNIPFDGEYIIEIVPNNTDGTPFASFSLPYYSVNPYEILAQQLIDILAWGDVLWREYGLSFAYCTGLTVLSATDAPNLSNMTSIGALFQDCSNFNTNINHWDVSTIQDFSGLFNKCTSYNQPLDNWDVGNGISFNNMFTNAKAFNSSLSGWDMRNATALASMFEGAESFNQNIENWQFGDYNPLDPNPLWAIGMFKDAVSFNQPLNNWDVGRFYEFGNMFSGAASFNQPLNNWKFKSHPDVYDAYLYHMFENATSFNQDLSAWDMEKVANLGSIFNGAGMSCENYSRTLKGWVDNNDLSHLNTYIVLSDDPMQYSESISIQHQALINLGWGLENDIEVPTAQCMPTPLPITLISFNATKGNKSVILNWEIASQVNNKGFLLQHSTDGNNWSDISFIYAGEKLKYEYLHETPINGINFYRFIQEDWDGTIIYSPIRSVQFDDSNEISVYPNPTNSVLKIDGLKGRETLIVYDVLGNVVLKTVVNNNSIILDVSKFSSGAYCLQISEESKNTYYKVVVN